jgi:hypothetical protein
MKQASRVQGAARHLCASVYGGSGSVVAGRKSSVVTASTSLTVQHQTGRWSGGRRRAYHAPPPPPGTGSVRYRPSWGVHLLALTIAGTSTFYFSQSGLAPTVLPSA